MLSGATAEQLAVMVAMPIQSLLPPPLDNAWDTARFRPAIFGKAVKPLVLVMCERRLSLIDWDAGLIGTA